MAHVDGPPGPFRALGYRASVPTVGPGRQGHGCVLADDGDSFIEALPWLDDDTIVFERERVSACPGVARLAQRW
jgi:hypothetical protein